MKRILLTFGLSSLICGGLAAVSAAQTVDFSDLSHPATGVGPSHPAYTQNGFSLLRIPNANDALANGHHFHTIAGSGSPAKTDAFFSSGDGTPFRYFYGNITGIDRNTYAVGTEQPFDLLSLNVFDVSGSFLLTASSGATITIDHAGVYDFSALPGFQNIRDFRHDYTSSASGSLTLDSLIFRPASVPEPSGAALVVTGAAFCGLFLRRRRN